MLTDAEYIARKGNVCPNCESCDIEGGSVEIDGSEAWQKVHCHECEFAWIDVYQLTGFDPDEK